MASEALAAAPAFSDLMPPPLTARRSTGGVLVARGLNDSFYGFGGFTGAGAPLTEFIEYRTSANAWVTAAPGLPGRERHALGYDPVNDFLVIVGGANGFTLFDTVLLIRGGTGTAPAAPTVRPSARVDALLAWIPEWGKFLYFGGRTSVFANNHVNDMWTLEVADGGVTWGAMVGIGQVPSARGATCWVREPASGRLIMFGGESNSNLADTWAFRPDAGWSQLTVTGTVPSARSFAACSWDANLNELVLYGGQTSSQVGGLFSFNPATNVWTSWDAGSPSPGPLSDSAAAFSPALGGTLLFGGQTASGAYTNRTWLLTFNRPPSVDAGPDQFLGEGALAQLSGQVTDPDGDPVSVSWTQTAGPTVTLSDAGSLSPTFTTPRLFATTQLTFQLRGADLTSSAVDDVTVSVQNNLNDAPVADAGPDRTVDAGVLVTLVGSGSDPDGSPLSANWMQVAGPAVSFSPMNAFTMSFVAPQQPTATAVTFALVVNDGVLASAADQVTVTVLAHDAGVDAGFDAGVDAGFDAGVDAGFDAGVDAGVDAGLDAGEPPLDAGADAGEVDGGGDAGTPDASVADAGERDAGTEDAGRTDAGAEDAGADAGSSPDAGAVADAGPEDAHQYVVGCGCTETPFSPAWMLGLIALSLRAGRRARGLRLPVRNPRSSGVHGDTRGG